MTRWRKTMERLADYPNVIQDLVSMLSAARVMIWLTLLNLGLGFVLFVTIATTKNEPVVARLIAQNGLGQFVAIMILLVLGGALTVFVPLRASGLIITPRLSRYFDQIVLSGISPVRYFIGRLLGVNAFALMLLAATLPYFVFAVSMGGVRFGFVLAGVLALVIYVNVLALATLAASLANYEVISTPGVIFCFGWVYVLGAMPLPIIPMDVFTPSRLFVGPIFADVSNIALGIVIEMGDVALHLPSLLLYMGFQAFLASICLSWIISGPLNCISLPNSMFGEVIMPGEKKRKSLIKRFGPLRRKSEICFLYENRPEWAFRYELFLRWGRPLVLILGAVALALAATHVYASRWDPKQLTTMFIFIFLGGVLFSGAIFSHDRSTEKTMVQGGRLRMTAGTASTLSFFGFVAVTALATVGIPLLRLAIQGEAWMDSSSESSDIFMNAALLLPLTGFTILHYYAFYRWLTMGRWEFGRSTMLFLFYFGTLMLVPILPVAVFYGLPKSLAGEYGHLETLAAGLSYVSPFPHILAVLSWDRPKDGLGVAVYNLRYVGPIVTYLFQGGLALLFTILAVKRHRSLDPWEKHRK